MEAFLTLGVAIWQQSGLLSGDAARPEVALGSSAYFLLVAAMLVGVATGAWRGGRWAYGPAVFVQVLAVPLAASMASEGLWLGTVVLGGLALAGLWLLLRDGGRVAFGRGDDVQTPA
jgi:hypothetical protein